MSHLYEILAQHPEQGRRLWLVVAPDRAAARAYVPESYRALSCTMIDGNASGPPRLIGWAGPSLLDRATG